MKVTEVRQMTVEEPREVDKVRLIETRWGPTLKLAIKDVKKKSKIDEVHRTGTDHRSQKNLS